MGIIDTFRSWLGGSPARSLQLAAPPSPSADIERALAVAGYDPQQASTLGEELARSIGGWSMPRKGTAELLTAYATTPWLHAVCRRRAEALSAVEWTLYKPGKGEPRASRLTGMRSAPEIRHRAAAQHTNDKRLIPVTDHPLLDLLEHPTAMAPGPLFWELVSKWLDLSGEAPQAIVFEGGEPVELTPILPTLITKCTTSDKPWFEVASPTTSKTFIVPEEDMIWVRQHDPSSPYTGRGIGTAQVLADEIETDEYMALTAKGLFFNRGSPAAFVGVLPAGPNGSTLTPEQLKLLAAEVDAKHRGVQRAGQLHFIGRDIRVATMGQTLVENQYIDGRKFLRDMCMQVFGTPPEILGVLTSSNRSTIDAADYLFAKFSTQPQLERLRSFYQALLVPLFGTDLVLDYVSPIPADREFKRSVMIALPQAFTVNQVLALAGEPARVGADGDRPYPAATGNVPTPGPKKETTDAPADP